MKDKEIGKLWCECRRILDAKDSGAIGVLWAETTANIICKLVEERALTRQLKATNLPRGWNYRLLALRDFGIDPETYEGQRASMILAKRLGKENAQ